MSNFDEFLSSLSDEQKQKLVESLLSQSSVGNKEKEPQTKQIKKKPSTPPSVTVDENFIVQKTDNNSRRREPVKARKNDWVDSGEFRDIETPHGERTPRNRPSHKKIDVECSVCGRTFKTDPRYVYGEYHRCSRCTGK